MNEVRVANPNPPCHFSHESHKNHILSIHQIMGITDVVNLIFEYSLSTTVCEAFLHINQTSFFSKLKDQYQTIHLTPQLNNSLDSILLCINGEGVIEPRQYCLEASKRVRNFVKNKLTHEIDILVNSELSDHNSLKNSFQNTIKAKKERLELLESKPDLWIEDEVSVMDKQLERAHDILFDAIKRKGTLPPEIDSIKKLFGEENNLKYLEDCKYLNLQPSSDNCTLTILPHEIGQIKNLFDLNLQDNRIQYLPNTIAALQDLECLNLKNNNLQQLPTNFSMIQKLQYFNLSHNKIRNINHLFSSLTKVRKLAISFEWEGLVSDDIKKLKDLKSIHFDNIDLLFPFLDDFPTFLTIFPSVAYLEANAHLFPCTINFLANHGMITPDLKKIKNKKEIERKKAEIEEKRIQEEEKKNKAKNKKPNIPKTHSSTCVIC